MAVPEKLTDGRFAVNAKASNETAVKRKQKAVRSPGPPFPKVQERSDRPPAPPIRKYLVCMYIYIYMHMYLLYIHSMYGAYGSKPNSPGLFLPYARRVLNWFVGVRVKLNVFIIYKCVNVIARHD